MDTGRRQLWLGLSLGLMAVVFVLSIIPGEAKEGDSAFVWAVTMIPTPAQKLAHVLCYALLAFLWTQTVEALRPVRLRFATAFVVTAGFGALMEAAQLLVPGRFGTLSDAVLNAGGALLGLLAAVLLNKGEENNLNGPAHD